MREIDSHFYTGRFIRKKSGSGSLSLKIWLLQEWTMQVKKKKKSVRPRCEFVIVHSANVTLWHNEMLVDEMAAKSHSGHFYHNGLSFFFFSNEETNLLMKIRLVSVGIRVWIVIWKTKVMQHGSVSGWDLVSSPLWPFCGCITLTSFIQRADMMD